MAANDDTDDDILYVLRHARFRGVAPKSGPTPEGERTKYIVRLSSNGHELKIEDTLLRAMRRAAAALRRLP